jgi:hypothetical protein
MRSYGLCRCIQTISIITIDKRKICEQTKLKDAAVDMTQNSAKAEFKPLKSKALGQLDKLQRVLSGASLAIAVKPANVNRSI